MNNRILSFLVVALLLIVCTGSVSAWEFDNVKSYNETSKTVTITNAFNLPLIGETIAEIKLNTPLVNYVSRGYGKVAEFTINSSKDYNNALGQLDLYNIKQEMFKFERDFDYKYLTYENVEVNDYKQVCILSLNGTNICHTEFVGTHFEQREKWINLDNFILLKGEIIIGLFTDVQKGDHVEWIPTLFGKEINEWAVWTEDLNVKLLVYYSLDEGSGTNLQENVSKINNLTASFGLTAGGEGKIGNGLDFTPSQVTNSTTPLSLVNNLTFSLWVKIDTNQGQGWISQRDLGDNDWQIGSTADGVLNTYLWGLNTALCGTPAGFIGTGSWTHIVTTYDGSSHKIWRNGVLNTTCSRTGNVDIGADDFHFGVDYIGQNYLDGKLDEIGIWNRTLSNTEISDLYNSGSGMAYLEDSISPTHSGEQTNTTLIGEPITFAIQYNDNVALHPNGQYIFSTNNTGNWVNESAVSFTSTPEWANVTSLILNSTNGTVVGYRWFADDNFGTVGNTEIFIVTAVDFTLPIVNIQYPTNISYTVNVTDLNYTYVETNPSYCWYSKDNGASNSTLQTCGTNWTGVGSEEGSNTWIVFMNDTSNNVNHSNVTFFRDLVDPNLNIVNPTESFLWYGFDTDGNNSIMTNLNWTVNDTNLDACWYTNGTGAVTNTTVTCGNNDTVWTPYGTYNWAVFANDTSNNLGSDFHVIQYGALINNSHTGNTTTYETKTESFAVNLTYPSAEFTTSAKLNYSGTSYTATRTGVGDFAVFTYTLDTPLVGTSVTNHSYYFNISLNNGTQFYYTTDVRNITVTPIIFQECNGTFLPFLNYTFKDEETDLFLEASVPSADFDFWLGSGDVKDSYHFSDAVDTSSYTFCFSLNETIHTDLTFQYKQDPGFPARTESSTDDLTNDTTFTILFLTGTANGEFITFNVQDGAGVGIADAQIQVERKVGGAWTTIATDNSDDAGQVAFYLDITLDHRLTVTHDLYNTEVLTIRPSQSVYTLILTLTGGDPAEYTSPLEGITYSISPTPGPWLSENTNYTFTYNVSANLSNLIFYSMNITLPNGTELDSIHGTTSTGGNLTIFFDTADYNRLYGYYYLDIGNGTYLIDPSIWVLRDITPGNLSIYNFLVYLKASETDIEDNYTTLFFLFFFLFSAMAAFTYSTGMELAQPGICLFILFFFVAICSVAGYFTIDFAPGDFVNQYGILLVVSLLTGGYALGQFSRT